MIVNIREREEEEGGRKWRKEGKKRGNRERLLGQKVRDTEREIRKNEEEG